MEFENQYLTFDEYVELGGTMTEMPFNLLEFEARKLIDKFTQGRLINLPEQNQNVKLCIYKLVSTIFNNNSDIANSENTDGYSITYKDNNEINKKAVDIIFQYLVNCYSEDGTPYLYSGVV